MGMKPIGSLLLTKKDVTKLLSYSECVTIVEEAFRRHGQKKSLKPMLMHVDADGGEFHVKAGGLVFDKTYFGLKLGGAFFENATRFNMPTIQGQILLNDGENGYPLSILDSQEITKKRTGAATAVAAKYLARKNSDTVTICGTGLQARQQLLALCTVFPIKKAYIFGRNFIKAETLANTLSAELGLNVIATQSLAEALSQSQICVTCTNAKDYFVRREDLPPGLFIAAVGADSPGKQEIDPQILFHSKIVVDILHQCVQVGELQHAIVLGMTPDEVHADLAEIILGEKPGRTSEEEIILFDSTGTALQDVAAAVAVYKKALELGVGHYFDFFD
jgi:ornithine cyclodeaminase/alanine dehydrogenase